MPKPKACVLRAPGTNCDIETAFAFEQCGATAQRLHLFRLLESPNRLRDYQILCVPGGFSYGDDIGAGVIFSRQLSGRLGEALNEFLARDRLVLGICNGFQVLLKAGVLPGGTAEGTSAHREPAATLTWNENGKYTAVWVKLRVISDSNVFLRGMTHFELPIAHAEGKFAVRDETLFDEWLGGGQIALCYAGGDGSAGPNASDKAACVRRMLPYPDNPNGSQGNIAGLGDPSGRVLGLMPHPERFLFATQHPQWTRRRLSGDGEGLRIFRNAVDYFG